MKVAFFSYKRFDHEFFSKDSDHELTYLESRLTTETALLAKGHEVVCVFANDCVDAKVISILADLGIRLIALRSAGFNHVDLDAAAHYKISVVRVPAYSPNAVAEHTVGMMLTLNRNFHKAYNRVREGNFALDGLLGFDFVGRTVGIIGTGKIGAVVAKIMNGFGCELLGHDPFPNDGCTRLGMEYVSLGELASKSDVITLHCPLVTENKYLINGELISKMKDGVMLINTSRGGLLNTRDTIQALKIGKIGYLGIDVYEEEADIFFSDHSAEVMDDDVFARLLTFPNVLVTGHQAFFTRQALQQIANTTIDNITQFAKGEPANEVIAESFARRGAGRAAGQNEAATNGVS